MIQQKCFQYIVPKVNFLDEAGNTSQAESSVSPGPGGVKAVGGINTKKRAQK